MLREETDAAALSAAAARDLARTTRALCDAVVMVPPGEHSERLLDQLQQLLHEVSAHAEPGVVPWFYGQTRRDLSDHNPIIPPLRLTVEGTQASGTVQVGSSFMGPPGRVHGGVLATIVDHAMGLLVSVAARASVTARLEMNYVGGAPIGEELFVEARIDEQVGRKTWVEAEISWQGTVCVRARGLFVAPASQGQTL